MYLEKILKEDDVVSSINNNMDYLLYTIPEIKSMIGFDQKHPHHHLDAWNHTLLALSLSKNDFDVRLVLLLHDIGKPFCYQDEEVRHFRGHPEVSSKMSQKILKRFDFSDEYINYICSLIEKHDTPIKEIDIENNYDFCLKLYEIQKCDAMAHHPDKLEKRKKYINDLEKKLVLKR
jgi:tRNA nucleotidyltransferase (CCA-adding enzyme)